MSIVKVSMVKGKVVEHRTFTKKELDVRCLNLQSLYRLYNKYKPDVLRIVYLDILIGVNEGIYNDSIRDNIYIVELLIKRNNERKN